MNKKKNLLVVTNVYPLPWQPTRGTYNKIQLDLLAKDFNVNIVVPIAFPEWLKNDTKSTGNIRYAWQFYIPIIGSPINGILLFLSLWLNSFSWIKKTSPDLLLTCWAYPDGVAGYLLSKLLNIPFFLKVHGSDINTHTNYITRRKQISWVANKAQKIVCVSKALSDKLTAIGVDKDRSTVIYNGVNSALFSPSDLPPKEQILFVGNIKRSKGAFEALSGFELILAEHPSYQLIFIGNGPDLAELKQEATKKGILDNIIFLGAKNHQEIAQTLKESKLLLLPSHAEGVPNVILEAMSCGVPSVATAVGGIPEILENGINGYLVSNIDSQEVANALELAISHPWVKADIINSAKQFNWNKNAAAFKSLLDET
ncbi:MAG: glycosyltransferase involved in cell wall biosynthesis [Colwellia sp.]|jgi:glycosyltransferase involved in cell wall biosynthesis